MTESSAASVVPRNSVYVLRVPARRDTMAPLARFEGRYDVVKGCLAFIIGGEPHLPAFSSKGDAYREGDTVTLGSQTIELGKTLTPRGSALDPYDLERATMSPPASCGDWPKIRL